MKCLHSRIQCILIIEQSENNVCMLQDNTSRRLAAKYELEFCRNYDIQISIQ